MTREDISEGSTYITKAGRKVYVHGVDGENATYGYLGSIDRQTCSLARLAGILSKKVPNE